MENMNADVRVLRVKLFTSLLITSIIDLIRNVFLCMCKTLRVPWDVYYVVCIPSSKIFLMLKCVERVYLSLFFFLSIQVNEVE